MTKQEEINKLREFLASVGDSYLREILEPIRPAIERAIRDDHCVIDTKRECELRFELEQERASRKHDEKMRQLTIAAQAMHDSFFPDDMIPTYKTAEQIKEMER